MAMLARQLLLAIVLLPGCGLVLADEDSEDAPDTEFLEYLGYWDESDEEWLIFEDLVTAELDEQSDPVPQGEESTEKKDES